MKLELKHLVGYLPYKLRIKRIDYEYKNLFLLGIYFYDAVHQLGRTPFDFIKPILRPLSDLTKEIEVNGEKFVPIYELCKMQGFTMPKIDKCELSFNSAFNQTAMIKMEGWIFRYLDNEKSFWLNGTEGWSKKHQKSNRQLDMFQKLLEWHFDIYGLIENDLAIDINTLKLT